MALRSFLLLAGFLTGLGLRADPQSVYPDPGLQDPRLRFHLGQVEHNHPVFSTVYPDMPFPVSPWVVAQWSQSSYMSGDRMTKDDPRAVDPRLGIATYAFTAPDGHSHVWIFHDAGSDAWTYDLYEQDGVVKTGGGSNIFLGTSDPTNKDITFDREITYSVDLKISRAEVSYTTPDAEKSGAVLGQVFTGFSIDFKDPGTGRRQHLFLQIPITHSRNRSNNHAWYIFLPTKSALPNLLFSPALMPGESTLPFAADPGPLHSFHYLLNRYVAQVVAHPYRWKGRLVDWPAAAHDFRNWILGGMYIGLETEATDLRPSSTDPSPQGSVKVGLQLSNLRVMRDSDRVFDPAASSP
jgi:hypothetical protein